MLDSHEITLIRENDLPSIELHTYLQAATSHNTRLAYQHDIRHFLSSGGLLPGTPDLIIAYLQRFATRLNTRTLSRRLTAIKQWHISQGFTDPTAHLLVRKILTGIKNIHGKPKDKAPALHIDQLIIITRHLASSGKLIDARNNALLQTGFFGAFRRSELAMIRFEQITFVAQGMEILIPRSKTDQGGEGMVCAIPYGNQTLCPVTAMQKWCQQAHITHGPVFCKMTKNGEISSSAIAANHINIIIKAIAQDCHLPQADQFSSHSLRRGFATTASQQGASLAAIMQQGRWQHAGTALGYMEDAKRFDDNAAGLILQKG